MRVNRPPAKATPSWFRDLAGFDEDTDANGHELTQSHCVVEGNQLRSLVNGKSFGIGRLELLTVQELRRRAASRHRVEGVRRVRIVRGDAGQLHASPERQGALFQVASQFNLLEMTGPGVTPEAGVSGYADDHTQGPSANSRPALQRSAAIASRWLQGRSGSAGIDNLIGWPLSPHRSHVARATDTSTDVHAERLRNL
jgi:hypothetical protein